MKNTAQALETNSKDSGILSNPLSFYRGGRYLWLIGNIDSINWSGFYWSLTTVDKTNARYMDFGDTFLYTLNSNTHGQGFAVRCVSIPSPKSFTNLINTSYSMKNNGQTSENSRDSGVLSNPLSFVHSGIFVWEDTNLYGRGSDGYYWLLYSSSTTLSNRLSFYNTSLDPQYSNARGYGFAVRCVQILHQSH